SLEGLPEILKSGIDYAVQNKTAEFDNRLNDACYISWNATDFVVVFKTNDMSPADISENLLSMTVSSTFDDESIMIGSNKYKIEQFNQFLTIRNNSIQTKKSETTEHFGNSDFIIFNAAFPSGQNHVILKNSHHKVWEEKINGPESKPLLHEQFMQFVPAGFSQLSYFGSAEFSVNAGSFLPVTDQRTYEWIDGGMMIVTKDSFQLIIAPQNLEKDLKMSLEEQTLAARGDTNFIPYFNIGNYEVMPFESDINWKSSDQIITENFHYYTHIDNFNVLANSIPAMRWYLGELQLGNLFLKSPMLSAVYRGSIPQRVHYFKMSHKSGSDFEIESRTWRTQENCIITHFSGGEQSTSTGNVQIVQDFEISIIPNSIQIMHENNYQNILVSNQNQIRCYDTAGMEKWALNLSTNLNGSPQIIDLENDGLSEVVLFQKDQIDVIRLDGHSAAGFPKKFTAVSNGGVAVNYDNAFNYRFLVSTGNQIKSLDEAGQPVVGWMFGSMTAELKGEISYYVTGGKDMISFKDINNNQYVINRRGESRLSKNSKVNLPNESPFVVGALDESSLRKLGYKNNYIYNYYLMDGHKDSVKLDKSVNALSAKWIFNNNQPLLIIEESDRVVVLNEFGYEKEVVLKPDPLQSYAGMVVNEEFQYVFANNSQNALYLLDGFGKMIFPVPVTGSTIYCLTNEQLYTFVGNKIKVYKTN
ncbi:MAG: hypothetical protein JNJ99_12785, partial [Crocinitomicaceae bacterium]|nr:hypothetical protein [Crocinitomicaceae bacterium]